MWYIVCVLVTQSCPTVSNPMDCSLPGSSVHEILQEKILEWVAISFSRGSSRPRDRTWVSCIAGRCFTVRAIREAPKEYWSGLTCPPPGVLQGSNLCLLCTLHWQAGSLHVASQRVRYDWETNSYPLSSRWRKYKKKIWIHFKYNWNDLAHGKKGQSLSMSVSILPEWRSLS